ncbi:MAG: EamA family transporter [Cryomorphaceae bacterium]|nr:EamA family transporter [Cryomorphaceae bacterium]
MRIGAIGLVLISVFLFTAANVFVKTIDYLPTSQIVFMRSLISLILCASFVIKKGFSFFGINKKWLFIRGFFGMIALTLFFYTVQNIPLASATVIQYLSPVFTMLLAIFFLRERVRPMQWLFLSMAIAGVLMVKGFDTRISLGFLGIGVLSSFFAAISYFATIKCKETDHPVAIVMWFHLLATPIMGAYSAADWVPMTTFEWTLGMLIGVLSVIAQIALSFALHRADVSVVTPFKYIGAILALFIGTFWFNEEMSLFSILGIVFVIAGVTLNVLSRRFHW